MFHPVSGEQLYAYTEEEQKYVKLALEELQKTTASHDMVSGGHD